MLTSLLRKFGDNRSWQGEQERLMQGLLNLLPGGGNNAGVGGGLGNGGAAAGGVGVVLVVGGPGPRTGAGGKPSAGLRKKTIACLGVLAGVLAEATLGRLLNILLKNVQSCGSASSSSEAALLSGIQCISAVARCTGRSRIFADHAEAVLPLFLKICRESTIAAADANDTTITLAESCLAGLECMPVRDQFFEPLCDLLLQLLKYDPNVYDDDDDDMGGSDSGDYDFEEDSEDDNSSWKVIFFGLSSYEGKIGRVLVSL